MVFEYDERKSRANLEKQRIDFIDAQALSSDSDILEIEARTVDGPRYLIIRLIGCNYWSAVEWMIGSPDREAGRLDVTRQSIIRVWLAERLEQRASNKLSNEDAVSSASS